MVPELHPDMPTAAHADVALVIDVRDPDECLARRGIDALLARDGTGGPGGRGLTRPSATQ